MKKPIYEKIIPVSKYYNIRVAVVKVAKHFNVNAGEWFKNETNHPPPCDLTTFEAEKLLRKIRISCAECFMKQLYSLYKQGKMIKDSGCYSGTIFFNMNGFKNQDDAIYFAESLANSYQESIEELSTISKGEKMTSPINFNDVNSITEDELQEIKQFAREINTRVEVASDKELMIGGIYWRATKILSIAENYLEVYEGAKHAEFIKQSHGVLADYDLVSQVLAELEYLEILPTNWEELAQEKRQIMNKTTEKERV